MKTPAIHLVFGFLLVSFLPLFAGFVDPNGAALLTKPETTPRAEAYSPEPSSISSVFSGESAPVLVSFQPSSASLEPVRQIPEPISIIALISTGALCLVTYRRLGKQR